MGFFDAAYAVSERPVRLRDVDPDLAAGCPPEVAISLATLRLQPGPWTAATELAGDVPAVLVVDGVLVRTVRVGSQSRSELLGDGDLICPAGGEQAVTTVDFAVQWEALQPARLALLDDDFFVAASRWPRIGAALTVRGIQRSQRLALQLAIADLRRIDERMIALLLHIGDRWGRMTREGIHVPLRLTHDLIAQLLGAQRPTVTTSLNDLQRAGRLLLRADRTWIVRMPASAA
jgi:hypothetical protein